MDLKEVNCVLGHGFRAVTSDPPRRDE
jgi:hypothetical protein